jgi:hypothetical protein
MADDGDDLLSGDDLWVGDLTAKSQITDSNGTWEGLGVGARLAAPGSTQADGRSNPDVLPTSAVDHYFLLAGNRTAEMASATGVSDAALTSSDATDDAL